MGAGASTLAANVTHTSGERGKEAEGEAAKAARHAAWGCSARHVARASRPVPTSSDTRGRSSIDSPSVSSASQSSNPNPAQSRSPRPGRGGAREEGRRDEEELPLFIVHLGITMGRASGTVLQKLLGIRQGYILLGYSGPSWTGSAFSWP